MVQRDANAKLAVNQYTQIVQKYRDYPRTDEVLFFLAHNLMDLNEEKKALIAYGKLVKDYPKSRFVPDAYLAFGEYYFNNSKGRRDWLLQGARGLQVRRQLPRERDLRLRPLQAGLVLLQPDRLPAGDGPLQGHRPLRRVRRRLRAGEAGRRQGQEHAHPRGSQRLRPRLRARGAACPRGPRRTSAPSPATPTIASR